jgi:hypothetical protein
MRKHLQALTFNRTVMEERLVEAKSNIGLA